MKHILIVDDDRLNLLIAQDTLKKYYQVSLVSSGIEALTFLEEKEVDLILLDIEMPVMNGIETLEKIKDNIKTVNIPVIFLTSINDNRVEVKCIELGAQDYIIKPFYAPSMLVRIRRVLELEDLRKHLESMVIDKTKEIECLTIQTITSFSNFIDAKDSYTKYHSQHVAKYAAKMAEKLGWEKTEIRNLYYSALLHDVGKIGVPDFILNKPGKLTEEEFQIIKRHPVIGGEILSEVTVVPFLSIGASNHHERYDGLGYPLGKKGTDIPLVGRIVGIVDAVDAMISTRAYREGGSKERAIEELKRCKGTQFDPELVPIMIEILESGIEFLDEEPVSEREENLVSSVLYEYSKAVQIDSISGLWNKIYMQNMVNEYLYISDKKGVLLLIDIDSFRAITNYCGQNKGNAAVVSISQGIKEMVGKAGIAGRVEQDKFVVFFKDIKDQEEAEQQILLLIKSLKERLKEMELHIHIPVSVGAAFPGGTGKDYATLYHNADKALYFVKKEGKKNYYIYTEYERSSIEGHIREELLDIWQIKVLMGERVISKGVYRVEITEFEKIFKLLQRQSQRTKEPISLLVFTLMDEQENLTTEEEYEEGYQLLFDALHENLRIGDIVTSYNKRQQIALIYGARVEMADLIIERVSEFYNQKNTNPNMVIQSDMEKII